MTDHADHPDQNTTKGIWAVGVFIVVISIATGVALFYGIRPMDFAVVGLVALGLIIVAFAGAVLWMIVDGKIPLSGLISEPDDVARIEGKAKASLSRFQFLIFTFVIAGLFLMLSIEAGGFVNVPDSVLLLMGVSGGGFIISKGVGQAKVANAKPELTTAEKLAANQEKIDAATKQLNEAAKAHKTLKQELAAQSAGPTP